MLVKTAYLGALSGRLTCSDVMQLLMDQPTAPVGRGMESHAHMHTREGFRLNQAGFGGDATSFAKKQMHWENPTHLYPAGQPLAYGLADYGRMVQPQGNPFYNGVVQDPNRLPPTREFADRTGLGQLPQVQAPTKYRVARTQVGGPPVYEDYDSMAQVNGLNAVLYKKDKSGAIQVTVRQGAVQLPMVPASPVHSMFPDSESQVMHLTGALLSDAGHMVLHHLATRVASGAAATSGIFSKIAVQAVTAADATVPNRMLERRIQVDQAAPRNAGTGQYPATGAVLTAAIGINHVVAVLGKGANGELNVITCYPCNMTTGATIGANTGPAEDVAEMIYTQHTIVPQTRPVPRLRW